MSINDAIKTLDEVIHDPNNKMVDLDHLPIAIAWKTVKEELQRLISSRDPDSNESEVDV